MVVTLGFKDRPLTQFQVYAPDKSYSDVEIDMLCEQLQDRINLIPRRNNLIILWDFDARIGHDAYLNWPDITGTSVAVNTLLQLCALDDLSIMNTFCNHKKAHTGYLDIARR